MDGAGPSRDPSPDACPARAHVAFLQQHRRRLVEKVLALEQSRGGTPPEGWEGVGEYQRYREAVDLKGVLISSGLTRSYKECHLQIQNCVNFQLPVLGSLVVGA